jgi:chromosome segregation ATPase
MTRQNKLPTDVLQERVNQLKAELAQTADVIADLEAERDADLQTFQQKVEEAKEKAADAQQEKDGMLNDADSLQAKGEALISSGKKLLREAQVRRDEAEALDLQLQPVRDAELALRDRQKHWSTELSRVQDGATRRKRSRLERDIAKLEKRLERKTAEPPIATGVVPVLPQHLGTPKPKAAPEAVSELRKNSTAIVKSAAAESGAGGE